LGESGTRHFLFFESRVQGSGSHFERQRGVDFVCRRFPGRPTRQAALESATCSFRFPFSTWEEYAWEQGRSRGMMAEGAICLNA